MDIWHFPGVELESKALTKIAKEEGDCASHLSVFLIVVARKRLQRENALLFPFYESRESRKKHPQLNSFRIELDGACFV